MPPSQGTERAARSARLPALAPRTGAAPHDGLAPPPAARLLPLQLDADAIGNAVQPTAERALFPERRRLAGQYQKRRLASVLGVVALAQHPPAQRQHHRPMPLDQYRE